MSQNIHRTLITALVFCGMCFGFTYQATAAPATPATTPNTPYSVCSNSPVTPSFNGSNTITSTSTTSCSGTNNLEVQASLWVHIPFSPDAMQSQDIYWQIASYFYRDATDYNCFSDPGNRRTFYTSGGYWAGGSSTPQTDQSGRVDYEAGC